MIQLIALIDTDALLQVIQKLTCYLLCYVVTGIESYFIGCYAQGCSELDSDSPTTVKPRQEARILRIVKVLRILKITRILKAFKVVECVALYYDSWILFHPL